MSLNLAHITRQTESLADEMAEYQNQSIELIDQALAALEECAVHASTVASRITQAAGLATTVGLKLMCAVPTSESIVASFPLPPCPNPLTIIASDGSQILPDPHASLLYYLVNVGCIAYRHGSGETPQIYHPTPILRYHPSDLLNERGNIIPAAGVRIQRDLSEITGLVDLCRCYNGRTEPVIALADGPLRLHVSDLMPALQDESLSRYRVLLEELQERKVRVGGYVDRPRSHFVLSMLFLAGLALKDLNDAILARNPYRLITDIDLFRRLLEPGARSAIFTLIEGDKFGEICIFYLNVARSGPPILARVEIPSWVANDALSLDLLHAAIVRQARVGGGYPYILARAHELATISQEERNAVETILATAMRRSGARPEPSPKQQQKNLLIAR